MTIKIDEENFMGQVTRLAEFMGWKWVHFRPARTRHGWRTPVSGPLGKGWPDLILIRARDHRLLFIELKAEKGKIEEEQAWLIAWLNDAFDGTTVEAHLWRPQDFDSGTIVKVLT
jgi:hypothetical protein